MLFVIGDNIEVLGIWNLSFGKEKKYVVWYCVFSEFGGIIDLVCIMFDKYVVFIKGVYMIGRGRGSNV